MQVPTQPSNCKLEATGASAGGGGSGEPSRSPVLVDVHRGADNQLISSTTVRHVQTSESAATTLDVVNNAAAVEDADEEKENEEEAAVSASGGTATVSFEMKAVKPRKTSSLKRSESGGVRPKEKLHGAPLALLLNENDTRNGENMMLGNQGSNSIEKKSFPKSCPKWAGF